VDAEATPGYGRRKKDSVDDLVAGADELSELQERLYASSRADATDAAVLLVLQGMDTAGKGGIIRHVLGSVDPQGVQLTAFKKPTRGELAHDFLWRISRRVPEPGMIGVFDRSHYEDVLIGRVRQLAPSPELEQRYGAINDFESELVGRGIHLVKVMLHISSDEQRDRLMERLDRADKRWKFDSSDVDERMHWSAYMGAYQTVFDRTSTDVAPWYVVPAGRKWYARLAVQALMLQALRELDPQWPAATYDVAAERARLSAT